VLLKDPKGILIRQTANVQSARQIRFTSVQEVIKKRSVLKTYIKEAISLEKSGQQVSFKKTPEFPVVKELQEKLNKVPGLKAAFRSLTPGRQRGYLLFFSAAKQSSTRIARIEKYLPHIFQGKGLND
ncbi:MAG: YdeI/OmpD-associated family protein, partial [Chitinophagaceae bacterium]|nr:YdeI/OmpD-associated family protein [Chitinophagaceae bacterium]